MTMGAREQESTTAAAPEAGAADPAVAGEAVHAPACGCGGCGRVLSPARVIALQRLAGNSAVSRAVSVSSLGGPRLSRVIDDRAYNAGREARDAWIATGQKGPIDHTPSTGRGGFSATYDPAGQKLTIELRGAVEFRDGMDIYFGRYVVATQPDNVPAEEAAKAINKLPRAERAAAMAPWLWTDAAKATFLTEFTTSVQDAWKGKHELHCSKEFWTDLGATVDVKVTIAAKAKEDTDHMKLVSYKESDATVASLPAHVADTSGLGSHDADENEMVVTSQHTRKRSDIPQSVWVGFEPGKTLITSASKGNLKIFGESYKSGGGPRCAMCKKEIAEAAGAVVNVEIPGEGTDPQGLAEGRFLAVKFELAANGMTDAATRCKLTVVGSGVDGTVKMGAGVQQIVAAHEAGHMFGLGDEYTAPFSGTGGDLGDPVDGDLGKKQGLPGAVAENTDTIMSVGQAVKPQHYATFLEALKHVTGMQEWVFGPAVPVKAPDAGADFATPPGPGPATEPGGVPAAPPSVLA